MSATGGRPRKRRPVAAKVAHRSYTIATGARTRWNLVSVQDPTSGAWHKPARKGPCWSLVGGRTSACPGCPAPDREFGVLEAAHDGFRLVQISPHGGNLRVDSCDFGHGMLAALFQERIRSFAAGARLSQREVEVLRGLVGPGGAGAIAATLGITVRTVRFHVRNVLRKTGTGSRQGILLAVIGLVNRAEGEP